jgi:hypothetical protein
MNTQELIEDFFSRGGVVTRVPANAYVCNRYIKCRDMRASLRKRAAKIKK